MFRLALRLFTFHELLALEHLIVGIFNKRFPQAAYSILNLLLELIALWIVLGNVFQTPIPFFLALIIQRLIDEDMGATKFP